MKVIRFRERAHAHIYHYKNMAEKRRKNGQICKGMKLQIVVEETVEDGTALEGTAVDETALEGIVLLQEGIVVDGIVVEGPGNADGAEGNPDGAGVHPTDVQPPPGPDGPDGPGPGVHPGVPPCCV